MFVKSVVVFVFFASVVMIPRWSKADNPNCPDAGIKANVALKNLLEDGKPINWKLFLGDGCLEDMMQKAKREIFVPNVKIAYEKVCYAVGDEKDVSVWVLSKTKEKNPATDIQSETVKDCANKKPYQSLYLPMELNKDTYMILNPQMAVLFFTTKLSGCDVFVAKNPNKPNQPLVVHSNRNEAKDEAGNFKSKGDDVNEILQSTAGYELSVRVYHKPNYKKTQEVIGNYKNNHKRAEMVEYNYTEKNEPFHFIGIFENSGWNFFLKRNDDGKIIWKKCLNQKHCVLL